MEGYIGQVILFAGTFAPRGWAFCHGQLLSIAQNTALFSIIGITYGGNGQTTFALPDLRGRTPVGAGQGPGLANKPLGQSSGEETHTLLASEMPAHSHVLNGTNADQTTNRPGGALPAKGGAYATAPNTTLAAGTVGVAGGSQPHNNLPPYLGLNYVICLEGIFPSRN